MFSKASSALAAIVFLHQLSSSSAQSSSSTYSADLSTSTACPAKGGVHIIVARGSLEAPPYGVQVATKDKILSLIPGSTADGTIGYPNTLSDYFNSVTSGALIARSLITDFVSRCPGSPLVLTGYSQGANVLGDALVGQRDSAFPDNTTIDTPLPDAVLSQVAALVFLGDPTFVVSESFHVGNATMNGSFPRLNSDLFNNAGLASRAQSYCDYNDLFCAGGSSIAVHVSYLPKYSDSIVSFVVKQVAAWYAANPSAGGAASSGVASASIVASASRSASASASASASKVSSVCRGPASGTGSRSVASGTAVRTASASASQASASSTSSPSATTSSPAVSTGAASSHGIDMTLVAGAGAIIAGLFAALL